MAVMKCPTCGRRPSERRGYEYYNPCTDELHDIADDVQEITATAARFEAERVALKARVEELERLAQKWEGLPSYDVARILFARSNFIRVETERDAARADLEEAVALLDELVHRTPFRSDNNGIMLVLKMEQVEKHRTFLAKHQPSVEKSDA